MSNIFDVATVEVAIDEIRELRDSETDQEMRSAYNDVCDRLDVVLSKLVERNKK